jgi:hypothetical protein
VNDVRVVSVITRERPDAVSTEEFVFVEHFGQHAAELGLIQDRAEPPARVPGVSRRRTAWDFPGGTDSR